MSALRTYSERALPPEKRKVQYVRRICEWCERAFELRPSDVAKGKGRYCSQACNTDASQDRLRNAVRPFPRAVAPAPVQPPVLPTLHWPEERHRAPQQCGHCGSRLLEVDEPYGLQKRGEIRCLMCARTLALLRTGWGERASVEVTLADDRCQDCGVPTGRVEDSRGRPRLYCSSCKRARDNEARPAARDRRARVGSTPAGAACIDCSADLGVDDITRGRRPDRCPPCGRAWTSRQNRARHEARKAATP